MNARLLEKGYKPISNEITLQIPGFKKPVECCFAQYTLKGAHTIHEHFIMGSKKTDICNITHTDNYELSKVVWDNIDKFENEEIKNVLLERLNRLIAYYSEAPKKVFDFLQMNEQEKNDYLIIHNACNGYFKGQSDFWSHRLIGKLTVEKYEKCCNDCLIEYKNRLQKAKVIKETFGL